MSCLTGLLQGDCLMRIIASFFPVFLLIQKRLRISILLAAAVLINGCASMTENECLTANWLDQGFRDGRNGQALSRLEEHRQACAKVGVTPNRQLYFKGREQGILHYCTPDNALQEGLKGRQYRSACPAHLEHDFLIAYEQGKEIYDAEQRVEKLNGQSSQLEKLLKKEKSPEERRYLRQELRDIDRELVRAREDMRYLERRLRY